MLSSQSLLMPITTVLRTALNTINSPRLLINVDHSIEFANEAFVQQFGRKDYQGKTCHALLFHRAKPCHEYGFKCPLLEAQVTNKSIRSRHTEVGVTGATHWDLEVTPILGTDGRPQHYIEAVERHTNFVTPLTLKGIVAHSQSVQALLKRINKVTMLKVPILFMGPHGSGKREFARMVHENSRHASYDFITIDCQGLTPEKLSQQLQLRCVDAFSLSGATLYFSDISLLSQEMQSELLTLVDTGAWIYKKGTEAERIYKNLRLIFASSMNLHELEIVADLRLDFLLKISACPLTVPGLEQRKEDIPDLIKMILQHLDHNGMRVGITQAAVEALQNRKDWKGHVTELHTIIMRAVTSNEKLDIDVADVAETPKPVDNLEVQESEDERLKKLILGWKGSKRELATRLGMSERTLYRRIEKILQEAEPPCLAEECPAV